MEDDEPSDFIKYQKFEPYMLNVLKNNEYPPDDPETLLAAFKVLWCLNEKLLDPEQKGYIDKELLKTFLEEKG